MTERIPKHAGNAIFFIGECTKILYTLIKHYVPLMVSHVSKILLF